MEEAVRLREPNRKQMILKAEDLDSLTGAEHPARAIWRVLEGRTRSNGAPKPAPNSLWPTAAI